MAEAAINLTAGQKADRKLDMIFVNVGGSGTETWELLGRGVEDASVEYNHDTDTVTDILGITDVNVSAAKSFPMPRARRNPRQQSWKT